MPDSSISFAHGVASGDPYADSVILWTRITPPEGTTGVIDVSWQISRSAGFEAGAIVDSGSFSTNAARDWTVKAEADGLNADTPYYYRFIAGEAVSMVGQTKTLPVGSDPVRLAVFSCANFPAAETFAAYGRAAAINAVNPYDAWVHLGDYIYEYGPGGYEEAEDAAGSRQFKPNREIVSLDDYRQRYAQYHTDTNLQALRAAAPLIAIWDDHETANDSWAGGAQNHQSASEGDWLARRDAALKAYYEWIPIREPGLRQASDGASALSPLTQGYRSFSFGDVLALHVLETRLTARDEQLKYPDAAAVQARIGAILAKPADLLAYAGKLGITPPSGPAAIPAFAKALAPLVTQELVIATVQQAWGDPSRDLIGAEQLAWLQQRMATSSASWQVLGQQVLMQSMAVPAELLLNAGDPGLLDKYAAPLQKLATGTSFNSLTPAEQALFAEPTKIPYNLDAWDGYGVERERILQTALALGKRLISLAGDTHNAWAGVLDTMSDAAKPAGTVAGVEFATPGVTSPGFEKYLPGADAYIRAKYPAVDGLDGLFQGYTNGLKYADLNRRGFLDLTITPDQAIGSFQLLDGSDPLTSAPRWVSETVSASSALSLSRNADANPLITWQPAWRELDLIFGVAVDAAGQLIDLDPGAYATVPRDGVELPDVRVKGSDVSDRIFVASGSTVEAGAGGDELFNTDSLGGNRLVGGDGVDKFFLRAAADAVIGGHLLAGATALGLPVIVASADQQADIFQLDTSDPGDGVLQILDFNPGVDQLLLDGQTPQGSWTQIRQQLLANDIAINAVPSFTKAPITLNLVPGLEVLMDLGASVIDPDGDQLDLVLLEAPAWISTKGTQLRATYPPGLTAAQLAASRVVLGLSDGKAVALQEIQLSILPPSPAIAAPTLALASDNGSSTSDGITNNPTVVVAGLEAGARWQYSSDGGSSWSTGSGNSFVLAEGSYAGGRILARQINSAGDYSVNGQLGSIKIDTTFPTLPALTVPSGSITASGDWVTYGQAGKAVVVVAQNLEPDAAYSYSEDNGKTWINFDGSSFNLAWVDPSKRWSLKVRQRDQAGNQGPESAIFNFSLFQLGAMAGQSGSATYSVKPLSIAATEAIKKASVPDAKIQTFSIEYSFSLDPSKAQGALLLDPSLLPASAGSSGATGFGFWGLDPLTGNLVESLTYDPSRRGGATAYDLNGDNIVDFIELRLGSTGLGDFDPSSAKVGGAITASKEAIAPGFFANGSQQLQIVDPSRPNSKGAVYVTATLTGRASTVNEIGFVVVDAGVPITLDLIRQSGNVLFSSLESTNVPDLSGVDLRSKISLRNGQTVRFYETVDSTLADLSRGKRTLAELGSPFRFLDYNTDQASRTARIVSASGISVNLSFSQAVPGLFDLIANRQMEAPVLDFTSNAVSTRAVSVEWSLFREAIFSPVFSLYRVLNQEGTVRDPLTGALFNPGDAGYKDASIRGQVGGLSGLTVGDLTATSGRVTLNETTFLAPMALVRTPTSEETFYAFAAANTDGLTHFRRLADNVFGLEDVRGGGDLDYDDHIFAFKPLSLV
jgi:phosphodiesterase/alkaline phosphatase D-like protein